MTKNTLIWGTVLIIAVVYLLPGRTYSQTHIKESDGPVINLVNPGKVNVGDKVVLVGSGFSAYQNEIHISIGGVLAVSEKGNTLEFTVPKTVSPCDFVNQIGAYCLQSIQIINPGYYEIYVVNEKGTSNTVVLTVTYSPVLDSPLPRPTPSFTPTPTATPKVPITKIDPGKVYSLSEVYDGDLIRDQNSFKVWVVKIVEDKRFKRLLFGPQIFTVYGHLNFARVKLVTQETLDAFTISNIIKLDNSPKVYSTFNFRPGINADVEWLQTIEVFLNRGYDFRGVFTINPREFDFYKLIAPVSFR